MDEKVKLLEKAQSLVDDANFEFKERDTNGGLVVAFLFGAFLNLSASIVYERWISVNNSLQEAVLAGTTVSIIPIVIYFFLARRRMHKKIKEARKLFRELDKMKN